MINNLDGEHRKVAIHGSYFDDNFGDTLLVRIMCDNAAALVGKDNVYLAVAPRGERELHDIGYPVIPAAQRRSVTHLIFGGGGYFGERSSALVDSTTWALRNYLRHLSWVSKFSAAKFAVIGAGFGPISNRFLRSAVGSLFSKCSTVLVRDDESLSYMRAYGIHPPECGVCVDLALSLPEVQAPRKGVALHINDLSQAEVDVVFSALASCRGTDDAIHVIFDNAAKDTGENRAKYELAARSNRFPPCVFVPYQDVSSLLALLAKYSFVVTSKLHVGIATIAQGGKAISIPAHQKTVRLYKQLGLADYCIPRPSVSKELLSSTIRKLPEYSPDRSTVNRGLAVSNSAIAQFLSR